MDVIQEAIDQKSIFQHISLAMTRPGSGSIKKQQAEMSIYTVWEMLPDIS